MPILRITGHEASRGGIVVSGAQVVEAEVAVVLFAAIQVVVGSRAGLGKRVAVGVVFILVRNNTSGVRELANRTCTVVYIKARRPCAIHHLAFADALESVGVGALDDSVDSLFQDLRQTSWVHIIFYEIFCCHSIDCLRDTISEGVVDHGDDLAVADGREHVILRVVCVDDAARAQDIAVGVVCFRGDLLVVGIVAVRDGVEAAKGRSNRGSVADRIEAITRIAVVAAVIGWVSADGLVCQTINPIIVPSQRAAIAFRRAGAIACRAELVVITRHWR